ncbi:MAG: helix-turn-helix domain-containing protein, partial [Caldilineaceae bacterium]|nr:helix-turn-helix domain-containing protein [Caldilineaceae bacterium]
LLSNAARFTVRGQIVLGAEDAGSHVHLWVQDTGRGMTSATLARIRQSRPAAEAIAPISEEAPQGLGLAIAHHLVQLHEGELSIESEPGHGTTCHIFLPKEASALEITGKESPAQDAIHQRHPRDRMSLQLVERVQEFVANNYAGALTREQIAAELGVSPAYVSRVFRQQCGMALWDYVSEYRIARACELLKHSDLTVTEVAFTVGFNDAAYFSRAFRKETGQSPAAYRASF